jgi:hypothetical protein
LTLAPADRKKVLVFTCDPGGAEVLAPAVHLMRAEGYQVRVACYGHAMARFARHGIEFTETPPIAPGDFELLRQFAPHFVVTSSSSLPAHDMSEKHLWRNAREMGIETVAFNDQWQNYALRFSGPSPGERLGYLPDFINCIDEIGRSEMLAEGFPEDRLLIFGHPHLAGVKKAVALLDRGEVLAALALPADDWTEETTLVFVSEPVREYFGATRGYDQYTVLGHFLENVQRSRPGTGVLIKLHPKDDRSGFSDIASRHNGLRVQFAQNEITSLECLTLSSRIFGMTSVMLIEAFLLGKRVVSLQPGLVVEDPLVLSRHKMISRVDSLRPFDPFACDCGRDSLFCVDFNATAFLRFLASRMNAQGTVPQQKGMVQS